MKLQNSLGLTHQQAHHRHYFAVIIPPSEPFKLIRHVLYVPQTALIATTLNEEVVKTGFVVAMVVGAEKAQYFLQKENVQNKVA
jgi:hypothetical protein